MTLQVVAWISEGDDVDELGNLLFPRQVDCYEEDIAHLPIGEKLVTLSDAQAEIDRLREVLRVAESVVRVVVESDYGRDWIWPITAHATAMSNAKEALAAIDAELKGEA